MTDMTLAIEMEGLAAGYDGKPVLSDMSAAINKGVSVAVVGPNGAGKSTLFKALVGQLPILAGRVLVYGLPLGQQLADIAYVPQREEVDWRFPVNVLEVVLMGRYGRLGWLSRPGREDRLLAKRCLERLGIGHLAERPIGELSGGQQQRTFLARALVQEPRLLILDEPFAGVDAQTRQMALAVLKELKNEGVAVLVSTHDLTLASTQFDQMMLINHGLVGFGSPERVLTPDALSSTFGDQMLIYRQAEQTLVVADHCCPADCPHLSCGE